jgi:site-specific recombinase XerD
MTFHDLRHTFASHWMLKGGDIYRLQKILGHRSVTTTERYAHMAPAAFREDWARLPDLAPKLEE